MRASIQHKTEIVRSARVSQVEGIFDVPPQARSEVSWEVELPLEGREWKVGLICGPSGCGKSTIAKRLFGSELIEGYDWPADQAILDGFPKAMGIKDITRFLGSVGFSSPPAWLRPYRVLSNGEQFRVTMARVLAEARPLSVVDEFTSVVDRQVAQIGSQAIAKAVRRGPGRFVAVSCHMDIEAWLQPDWVYLPAERRFFWRSLQRRPEIQLVINRAPHTAWHTFKHHHYLSSAINKAALCFVAFIGDRPVGFDAWLPFVGRLKDKRKAYRGHRTVVLPDFQGVGIGYRLVEYCAALLNGLGYRVFSGSGHPSEIASRIRSPRWRMTRPPGFSGTGGKRLPNLQKTRAIDRLRASFEWCGQPMDKIQAQQAVELRCRNVRLGA